MFVMATLYSEAGSVPVKIRNLSPLGALVEGAIPWLLSRVRLCRGSLIAEGEIAWSEDGRAGLRFDSPISVVSWLPTRAADRQQRIDEVVYRATLPTTSPGATCPAPPTRNMLSPANLTRLRNAIEALAGDIAADTVLAERHAAQLQVLDIAAVAIAQLAADE